jgi:hypothetical protein
MRNGLDCDYDKRNMSVVICDIDIQVSQGIIMIVEKWWIHPNH